jgi:hypothetical protein
MTDRVDPLLKMVARTATITDRQLAERSLDAQRDLVFERIVSSASPADPGRGARRGRLLGVRPAAVFLTTVAVLLVAIIAVLVAGQTIVSPTKAKAAGVRFARHAGYIDATIDDPTAPAASMEAAFAEYGLDITVQVLPASPSLVGTITFMDTPPSFEPIYGPEGSCLLPGGGTRCIIGMRVPSDFSGTANIVVDGAAAPGQLYHTTVDALAPGEVLHCSGVLGMTVSQAAPILEKLGLTAIWRTQDGSEPTSGVSQSTVEDEFVTGTDPVAEGTVRLWVQPQPPPHSDYYDSLDRGC